MPLSHELSLGVILPRSRAVPTSELLRAHHFVVSLSRCHGCPWCSAARSPFHCMSLSFQNLDRYFPQPVLVSICRSWRIGDRVSILGETKSGECPITALCTFSRSATPKLWPVRRCIAVHVFRADSLATDPWAYKSSGATQYFETHPRSHPLPFTCRRRLTNLCSRDEDHLRCALSPSFCHHSVCSPVHQGLDFWPHWSFSLLPALPSGLHPGGHRKRYP
jgi:hypothetical protein